MMEISNQNYCYSGSGDLFLTPSPPLQPRQRIQHLLGLLITLIKHRAEHFRKNLCQGLG
jgi:hypothetical protein